MGFLDKIFKSRKLRVDILTEFFVLLLATSFSIIWYTYENNSKSVIKFSDDLMKQISNSSIERMMTKLDQTKTLTILTGSLISLPEEIDIKNERLVKFMMQTVALYDFIENIYIGSESGQFLQVRDVPPNTSYRSFTKNLPNTVKYSLRFIDRSGGNVSPETWYYRNAQGKVIDQEVLPRAMYDHRNRVWYTGARQSSSFYWSDLYIFNTDKLPGMTASYPIIDATGSFVGVVGADITMADLSNLLLESKIGKNGVAFVVSHKGELIAHQDIHQVVVPDGDDVKTALIDEVADTRLAEAFRYFRNEKETRFIFHHEGIDYVSTFTPFPKEFGKEWYVGIIVPLDEFTGGVNKTQRETFLISLIFLLISAIMVIFLSKKFSQPIVKLAQEANNLKNFKLDEKFEIKSNTYEIQLMVDAITSMKKMLRAFSKFVPKDLVIKLMQKGMDVKIGGRSRELTIMFTDIQGFTTVSENYPSEKLMTHLSEYFSELSRIIMDHHGTIDKYIGDSIMAFWGAPITDRHQALNACRSALLMQKRLKELNRKWTSEGKPKLFTRIGIHTGSAVVGNMGSSDRMNYTIIGDSVNLASRLEHVNKDYGTYISISEDTYLKVADYCLVVPTDIIRVRGRQKPVKLYELIALKEVAAADDAILLPSQEEREYATQFMKAFDLYLEHHWEEAMKIFVQVSVKWGESKMLKKYIQRCELFQKTPPPLGWDGVYDDDEELAQDSAREKKK